MSALRDSAALNPGFASYGDVVEIGLLLPANWADALVELSKRREQSVAQILRHLIDQALHDAPNDGK